MRFMSLCFALLLKLSQTMQPKYHIKKLCHIKAGNCNGLENVHLSNLLKSILVYYHFILGLLSHPTSRPFETQKPGPQPQTFIIPSHWSGLHKPHYIADRKIVEVTGSLWCFTSMGYILLAQPWFSVKLQHDRGPKHYIWINAKPTRRAAEPTGSL